MLASFLACYLSSRNFIKVFNILDKKIEKIGKIAPLMPAKIIAIAKAHMAPLP